ncbi:MAG: DUF3137 domain-containing protein [Parvularculaceae bacterium]|nr:DUF3137 domain-containing protein [Parvularculaceae bacterium]
MRSIDIPSHPEFSAMGAFYGAEIAPYLAAKERDRRAAVLNVAILVAGLSALAIAVLLFGPFGPSNVQAAIMIALAAAVVGTLIIDRTRNDIAHGLLERIAGRLGFDYRSRFPRPEYCEKFSGLKLLPAFNRETWEDEVRGVRDGSRFVMCEAHLKYKTSGKNSSTRTVFHGQLLMLDYPRRFFGRTVVVRDSGILNALMKPGRDFQRVGLASAEFEKAFEAWSTDQVEARELLDPLVLERFQELERLFKGKKLRAAFSDGQLLIALEAGDRLNMGSMFKPLADPARVEVILSEFGVVFDLMDAATKPVEGRMTGAFSLGAVRPGA